LDVSAIGFGCWELGGDYGPIDERDSIAAINRAIDLGINCFDTAEAYGADTAASFHLGRSESLLAKGLGNRRHEVILVTKFGICYFDTDRVRDSRRERVISSIEGSLRRLNTDYLDVYLIHWPDDQTPFDETMRALEGIVQQGKVRFVGVSNFRADQIAACMETRRVDVGQYGYSLFDRRMERSVFPYCQEHGIGVMGYGSLAYGLLTGTLDETTKFPKRDWRSRGMVFNLPLFTEEDYPRNIRVVAELKRIAARRGKSIYDLALAWVLSNPTISVALVGMRNPEEVEANVAALGWTLTGAEHGEIDAAFAANGVNPSPDNWVE
jgi:aryl-alcohol dehydrogenase-like predicted oxidoreductase